MLIQKYSRKLDRAEATTLTIQDVKLQMRQGNLTWHKILPGISLWKQVFVSENSICLNGLAKKCLNLVSIVYEDARCLLSGLS